MTPNLTTLRKLAEAAKEQSRTVSFCTSANDAAFFKACSPSVVIALLDRVERLEGVLMEIGHTNAECDCVIGETPFDPTIDCQACIAREALKT